MKHTRWRNKRFIPLAVSAVVGLTACQPPAAQLNTPRSFMEGQPAALAGVTVSALPKLQGHAQGLVHPDPDHPGKARVTVNLRLQPAQTGFKTQVVQPEQLTQVHAAILGSGLGPEGIYADTADAAGQLEVSGGTITLSFSNIPYGPGKILRLAFSSPFDEHNLREEVRIGAAFHLTQSINSLDEISYRTTPVADIMFRLWAQSEDVGAAHSQRVAALQVFTQLSLSALQDFVDQELIVKTGMAPNYHYLRHPASLNSAAVADALLTNGGDIQALKDNVATSEPLPYYQLSPWAVNGTISGLVSTDTVNLYATDPVSTALNGQGNGGYTLVGIQGQTTGLFYRNLFLRTTQAAGTTYSLQYQGDLPDSPHSPGALVPSQDFTGTFTRNLVFVPATPSLSSLTPSSAAAGDTLTLTGTHFHLNADGNSVMFGNVPVPTADITVLSDTEIQVKVPAGLTEPVAVTVHVGSSQSSNPQTFIPYIASGAKEIQSFGFLAAHNPGLVSDVTGTVTGQQVWVTLPEGTSVHNLTANFGLSTGASLYLNDTLQQANTTRNNFAYPLSYTVTAENGSTQTYQVVAQTSVSALDTQVQSFMSTHNVPGMTLTVARNGQIVYAKGYGEANTITHEKVTNRHLFRIASITKPMTAAMILKLAEEGAFQLDDKVFGPGRILGTQYGTYPYGAYVTDISVRNLLEHMVGGWPNDGNDPVFQQLNLNQNDLMHHILNNCPGSPCSLTTVPGTQAVYSNAGYFILGRIIEQVTGQSYEAALKTQLAQPLGISDLYIGSDSLAGKRSNEVVYYPQEPYPAYNNFNLPRLDSVGGWIAAGPDLVRLLYDVEINHGWSPYAHYGWWNHTGALPGTGTLFVRDSMVPGSVYTWSVLTNTRHMPQEVFFETMRTTFQNTINGISQWPQYE